MIDELRRSPQRFEFVQAVRLLERAASAAAQADGRAAPGLLGIDNEPRHESVRLRAALELEFPASEVSELEARGDRTELSVSMLGLNGVSGVLPSHYSRYLLEASRDKNDAPRDFYDMFNHRALSFFLRAAEKYRLDLGFERGLGRQTDTFSSVLYALIGFRGEALRDRQMLPDEAMLAYAGSFAHRPRNADSLRRMLADYFRQPVLIQQFQGRWVDLAGEERTRLGATTTGRGYATLGENAIVGARVWDVQGAFRIRLGPLDYADFMRFVPGEFDTAELAAMARTYVGAALSFDLQLTLRSSEIPPLTLASARGLGARLGWNTWLPTAGTRADADDAVFTIG